MAAQDRTRLIDLVAFTDDFPAFFCEGRVFFTGIQKGDEKMKALFIGGTGTISTAVSALAVEKGIELTLLNRGTHLQEVPKGARVLRGGYPGRSGCGVSSERRDIRRCVQFYQFCSGTDRAGYPAVFRNN